VRSSTATSTRPGPTLTTEDVWRALEKASFAVVSHVTPAGEPRSSGVLVKAVDRKLWFVTASDSWKAKHLAGSGRAAATVLVRRGGLLSLLFPIPPASICLHGAAIVHDPRTTPIPEGLLPLLPEERREDCAIVEILPEDQFLTYGIGVPLMQMRDTARSRAHVPVG
jgi:hypothetical protein